MIGHQRAQKVEGVKLQTTVSFILKGAPLLRDEASAPSKHPFEGLQVDAREQHVDSSNNSTCRRGGAELWIITPDKESRDSTGQSHNYHQDSTVHIQKLPGQITTFPDMEMIEHGRRDCEMLPYARVFPLPAPFKKDPFIVPTLPMPRNPHRVRTGGMHPSAGNPHIMVTARRPAIVTGDPYDLSRGPYNDSLRRWSWRTDVDSYSDMKLCENRDCDGKRSRQNCGFQKCFHGLFPYCEKNDDLLLEQAD